MSRELDRIRNALMRRPDDETTFPVPTFPANSLFSFRYTRTEISLRGGGDAHVTRKEARFENGRLVTEEAEGTVDVATYDRMVDDTQRYFADQMTQAMKLFFLPLSAWRRDRD